MRLLALLAVVALSSPLAADDKKAEKIDPVKLVGKWKLVTAAKETPPDTNGVIEFTKTGGVVMTFTIGKSKSKLDTTYKVNGGKIDVVMQKTNRGRELIETWEVVKLTDTALHIKSSPGGVGEYERVKEEKGGK